MKPSARPIKSTSSIAVSHKRRRHHIYTVHKYATMGTSLPRLEHKRNQNNETKVQKRHNQKCKKGAAALTRASDLRWTSAELRHIPKVYRK